MIPTLTPRQIENFFKHIAVGMPNDCWEWQGARHKKGHGQLRLFGRGWLAHRVMYMLSKGDPTGLIIRHTCDNPPCCNPKHLLAGTHQDNVNDCVTRNRHAKGEKMGSAKLTATDVQQIKALLKLGTPQSIIARSYQINQSSVSDIHTGKTWSHITD